MLRGDLFGSMDFGKEFLAGVFFPPLCGLLVPELFLCLLSYISSSLRFSLLMMAMKMTVLYYIHGCHG